MFKFIIVNQVILIKQENPVTRQSVQERFNRLKLLHLNTEWQLNSKSFQGWCYSPVQICWEETNLSTSPWVTSPCWTCPWTWLKNCTAHELCLSRWKVAILYIDCKRLCLIVMTVSTGLRLKATSNWCCMITLITLHILPNGTSAPSCTARHFAESAAPITPLTKCGRSECRECILQICRKFSWMIVIEGVQNDWPLETPPFSTSPSNKDVLAETLKNPKQPNPVHHVLAACPESCTAKAAKVLMQSGWWRGLQKDMFCNSIQQGFSKGKNGSSSFSGWICSTLSCTNLSIKSQSNWPNSDATHIPQCGTFLNIHSVNVPDMHYTCLFRGNQLFQLELAWTPAKLVNLTSDRNPEAVCGGDFFHQQRASAPGLNELTENG